MIINNVGIIGYGRFGRLLASILENDFDVFVCDKKTIDSNNRKVNISHLPSVASKDAIFFCVPILGFKNTVQEAAPYIQNDAVVLDVCSVKIYPTKIMNQFLPDNIDILPTHPMFGPDSASKGLEGLPYVLCPNNTSPQTIIFWSKYFESKKLKVIEMSCDEHDEITAYSLCITHLFGRLLDKLEVKSSNIDTQNFMNLLGIRENACNDTFELFKGLQNLNPYAKEMRIKLKNAMFEIEDSL
jgi:prephenate dehydrogenase